MIIQNTNLHQNIIASVRLHPCLTDTSDSCEHTHVAASFGHIMVS